MINSIFPPNFAEQSSIPAGKLDQTIQAFQHDQQTGVAELEIPGKADQLLLFARGQLVTVYNAEDVVKRMDPAVWIETLPEISSIASLRMLALTPQDVRIFKILIEQKNDKRCISPGGISLENQLAKWKDHPVLALAHVVWPEADALVMFPGLGAAPIYTLFATSDQILHSAGGLTEMLGWHESYESLRLFSCEPRTLAWTEYLLYYAFSKLVSSLLGKFEKLIGRILLNQIIRDVNFKATAHDWKLSISASNVNDQTIFDAPSAAAEVYTRLLEVIFHQFESVLGETMLVMLVRESVNRLPAPARDVIKEYLPITNLD